MTAQIIKFPWRNFPVTVPIDHEPCSIIILPVVHIERNPDDPIDGRRGRRRRRLPKLFQVRSEG